VQGIAGGGAVEDLRLGHDSVGVGDVGYALGLDRDDDHVVVQDVVVLDVRAQRERGGAKVAVQEHRDAGHLLERGLAPAELLEEVRE
jgi:hypothetical protein